MTDQAVGRLHTEKECDTDHKVNGWTFEASSCQVECNTKCSTTDFPIWLSLSRQGSSMTIWRVGKASWQILGTQTAQ